MIRTPADLKAARRALGWSLSEMAGALRLTGANAERMLRDMEAGAKPISGPIAVAVEAYLSGWRPCKNPAGPV